MNGPAFVTGLGAVLAAPVAAEAQQGMKTATALGLTIPPSLLLRKDHVIE